MANSISFTLCEAVRSFIHSSVYGSLSSAERFRRCDIVPPPGKPLTDTALNKEPFIGIHPTEVAMDSDDPNEALILVSGVNLTLSIAIGQNPPKNWNVAGDNLMNLAFRCAAILHRNESIWSTVNANYNGFSKNVGPGVVGFEHLRLREGIPAPRVEEGNFGYGEKDFPTEYAFYVIDLRFTGIKTVFT